MNRHRDLRAYLAALEELSDLRRIRREVDWDLEAAAVTRLSCEHTAPAPLFENVTGVRPGFRLLGAPAALSSVPDRPLARVALSLGLSPDLTAAELVDHLVAVWDRPAVPPKTVSSREAPCKQNVLRGDDATLDRFPVPRLHQQDGGRYPNSWGASSRVPPTARGPTGPSPAR
jgi:UbiD family decarboxylase